MNKYQKHYNMLKTLFENISMFITNDKGDKLFIEENVFKSFDVLKELVEKETPKKVNYETYYEEYYTYEYCPNCHMDYDLYEYLKYCPNCGQRLKWK
jgi:PHP family Zn ribbon phosphoesterase